MEEKARVITVGDHEHRRLSEMSVGLDRTMKDLIAGFINHAYDQYKLSERIRNNQRKLRHEKRYRKED